jgi:tRNA uridine 5-carbamoylmethylation protein Kti12
MKIIVIYGPPAVGKLAVAQELANITGYKLLHNHLAIDLVESVLDRKKNKFWELIDSYRLSLLDAAAQESVDGVILTSVNIKGKDDAFIKSLIDIAKKNSGDIYFVHLKCEMNKLKGRLQEPSRKEHGKLMDIKTFERFVSENDVFDPIPFVDSFSIDNTNVSAAEAAMRIKKHYKL